MQFPEVAGFDPVFWLHHANVDRLFAMWQALYPDSYIVPTVNTYGSYYEAVGTTDSGTSGLCYTIEFATETNVWQLWLRFILAMTAPCSPQMAFAASRRLAIAIQNCWTGK